MTASVQSMTSTLDLTVRQPMLPSPRPDAKSNSRTEGLATQSLLEQLRPPEIHDVLRIGRGLFGQCGIRHLTATDHRELRERVT